ncbi:MAG: ribonuclease J, partial [Patescibacteria group bacterium]
FPEEDMLGVDYVIPDIRYLVERKNRIRGILVTHGHLDHIGALPYVLPDLNFPPIYTFSLTAGLITKQLEEHKLVKQTKITLVDNKTVYKFGKLEVEFFRVNHSIPDSNGMVIRCPEGSIVHTGDFKFDFTPADGVVADIERMSQIGKRGVHILFSDSTNAMKPGHTISERVVGDALESAISNAEGRIIIASFSSLVGRIQQILDFAHRHGRFVFASGRSMESNMEIAQKLGFLKVPKDILKPIKSIKDFKDSQILVVTTGSQGEPMSALARMANDAHMQVKIKPVDTVVVSSSPIIGNERATAFLVDQLARLGAHIVHNKIMDVHTSGHGQQEDLKMMMSLIRPQHLVPIHGSYYMRQSHADLGPHMSIPATNTHMMDNGNVIELRGGKVEFKHEDIKVNYVVVDGLGRGDLGSQVLKDRELMAQNGVVNIVLKVRGGKVVDKPMVSTRGFVYQKETEKIIKEIEKTAQSAVLKAVKGPKPRAADIEQAVKGAVSGYIQRRLDRRPVVTAFLVT